MAHINGNDIDTAHPRYETPTFDPRGAFSWTLRAGEIARVETQRQRNGLPDHLKKLESREPDVAQVNGNEMNVAQSPRYETPTFDPRSAFSWTLRSAEIARLERQQRNRRPDPQQLDILVAS